MRSIFYRVLGFSLLHRVEDDDVAVMELNLIFNAGASDPAANVLMDAPEKYAGYTHMALQVASIPATIVALRASDTAIIHGPVGFDNRGQVSIFIRNPDRNVIELRGRDQDVIAGVTRYVLQQA
jgi:lactoylglutathione lyase